MQVTLNQYIANPLLKGGRVLSAVMLESARKDYTDRFNKLNLRENSKWNFWLYTDKEKNEYYIYIKVPSETIKNFYYDVVFKFYADLDTPENMRDLNKYYFQIFSNDPAFCYTYAYVFLQNDLIIPDLKEKLSPKAVKQRPEITNPTEETGYVKSIYFAYLFIQNRQLNKMINFEAFAVDYKKILLTSSVMNMDDKVGMREDAGKRLQAQKKRQKEIAANQKEKHLSRLTQQEKDHNVIRGSAKVKTVKSTKTIKTSNKIKKSKRTK